jgi:hypothetical protein
MKIANRDARRHVQNRTPFKGANLYGRHWQVSPVVGSSWELGNYGFVVFSYGEHWPLFISTTPVEGAEPVWFENEERHSVTTSKHRSQSHPHVPTTMLSRGDMRFLLTRGYRALVRKRMGVGTPSTQTEFHKEVA